MDRVSCDGDEGDDYHHQQQQQQPRAVKEGWLLKRGEHIKNWRNRYFMLLLDGRLLGYRARPVSLQEAQQPLNNFTVRGCQLFQTDIPRPNSLILRGLHKATVVERIFSTHSVEERNSWLHSIQQVRDSMELAPPPSPQKRLSLADFQFIKVLGRGSFGKVVLCRELASRNLFAMKILKKDFIIEKNEVEHTRTENRVLQSIRHPFLVGLKYAFTTEDRLCLVMEYVAGGELFEHLAREGRFVEDRAGFYAAEITLALGYLHSRGIIYRDLKLENLVLDIRGHVKIVDFGLCKDDIFGAKFTRTMCGTPAYMPPEVIVSSNHGRAVDWWSLGIVLYEMVTGVLPFEAEDRQDMFQKILKDKVRYPRSVVISTEVRHLVGSLLVKDPATRLGSGPGDAAEVMASPFFASLSWTDLERGRIPPPFKPEVSEGTETPYLSPEFVGQPVDLTPPATHVQRPASCFSEFSFYNPHSVGLGTPHSTREMEVSP